MFLRETEARQFVASHPDAIARNLHTFVLGELERRKVPTTEDTREHFLQSLPSSEFDVAFLVSLLDPLFSRPDTLLALLNGSSVAEATGWDI